jgi:hypothetical protein
MKKLLWPITTIGMTLLGIGLVVAIVFETCGVDLAIHYVEAIGVMPPAYVVSNAFWILGAAVLIIPPIMAGFEMLVVLQIFLVVSGFMSFWQPESFALKVASRVGMSLLAVGYLKHRGLIQGFTFPWSLIQPRFYKEAWVTGDNRALAAGLEMLGIGYALSSMTMFTLGSAYLVRSAWASWKGTGDSIFTAWVLINVAYVLTGVVIITARLVT